MSTELIIAGEMGKGGGSTEYKDTLISEQTVKTLFAIGEGVIDSVENVYLDTVEIANFDATLNYKVGTSSQEVIDGFTVTEASLPGFTAKNIIRDSTKPNGQELPNVSTGITVAAVSLVKNTWYRITSVGSTDFKSFGASKNAVGTVFQASKAGSSTSGTGSTVQMELNFQVPETIVSIPYEEAMKSVRCSFTFSALSKTDGDGNIVGSTVVFEVYVRNNTTTGLWTLLNNKQYTVKGKTTHGYTFDLEINRPVTATTIWQIKVIRITPDSGTVKKQDTMQWSAVTQLYHSDLTYPGTALAAVTLRDATQFGNRIPEIMFKVKGKKIRLPTNYTPSTSTAVGTYNGNWDGTLHTTYLQYSNNPAWCLYDVLADVNSGLGIPEADLDKYSFYNLGKYCDDALPNGYSEAVVCRDNGEVLEEPYPLYIPRHTLDYSFNTRENVKDFLSQILSLCNANLITNEFGQVAVIFQQRGQIVKRNVTNANVIDGTFTYQSSNIEQRTNLVNVTYNRGLNFGRTDTATISDDSLIDRYGLRPTDVVLPGCYHEAQAIRKARWVLYTNCYFTDFVTFSVFLDGMTYKIGDLIRVYDNYNQTNTQSGLLTSAVISGSSTTLTFDREISLPAGTYTFHSYDSEGTEITKVISGGVTLNSLVISSVLTINIGVVFIIAGTSEGKIYRVTSISRSEENIYSVTALEFDETIFDYIDSGLNLTQKTGDFANVGQFSTVPVESISVKENFGTNGTYTNGRLQVSWVWDSAKTQKYRANFKVTWLLDDGIPTIIDTITSDTYDIMNPVPGVYTISVWAVNSFTGIYSQVLTTTYNFRTVTSNSTLLPPINVRIAGTEATEIQPATLEFSTPELTLAFDYNPENQSVDDALYDYLAEVWDSTGATKVESYSLNPVIGDETVDPIDEYLLYKPINGTFALPFSRNVNIFNGTAARTFIVKLYSRDTLGDLSLPIEITVTNPVPAFTSFSVTPDFGKVRVDIEASSEIDVRDYFIYRGTIANFAADETTLYYKGPSNSVALTTPDTATYYYKCAISDSFGETGLQVSSSISAQSLEGNANFVTISGEQFFTYASGATTPRNATITLTATLHGTLTTYLWQYWNGSAWATLSGTAVGQNYILYPDNTAWGTSKLLRIRCLSDTMAGEISIVKVSDGANGIPGYTTATVYIYQRLAGTNPPALPTVTTTYTFASAVLTGLNNGWVTSIPAGTDPLYVSAATASAGTATDTISANEWATPVVLAKNGDDGLDGNPGTNGINTATIYLYQTTTTSTPPTLPNVDLTYTFSTGNLTTSTGLQPDPWKRSLPTTGNYRWVTTATALSTATTDIITSSEWAAVSLLAKDGTNAAYVIVNGEQAFKFAAGSSTPASSTITLTAALFGGLTTYSWEYWSGSAWTALSGTNTNPTYSLAYNNTAFTGNALRIRCASGTSYDEITVLKLYDGVDGKNAVSGYLTNETVALPADSNGTVSNYSLASGNFKVFNGTTDVAASCSFSTSGGNSGISCTITGGSYSISGTMNADTASFTLSATYSGTTISKVLSITRAKTGAQGSAGPQGSTGPQGPQGPQGNQGITGPSGKSAVRAYQVTSSAGTPPTYTTSTSNGTLPGVSWSSTQGTVGVNQFQWQIDGIADYSTGTTTWTNPYLSVFKVDTLAAFTVNTGALTVNNALTVSTGGVIKSGMTGFAAGTGYWLDYNSGTPRFSIGTGSAGTLTKGISWNGSTFTVAGDVIGTANINANAVTSYWQQNYQYGTAGYPYQINVAGTVYNTPFTAITMPTAGVLAVQVSNVVHNNSTATDYTMEIWSSISKNGTYQNSNAESYWIKTPSGGAQNGYTPHSSGQNGSMQVFRNIEHVTVNAGDVIIVRTSARCATTQTVLYLDSVSYTAVLYKR